MVVLKGKFGLFVGYFPASKVGEVEGAVGGVMFVIYIRQKLYKELNR